jgi:GAF domain-containing protein
MQQETLHFASFSNHGGPERRRHSRLKLAASRPAVVEIAPGELCAIVDISEGGMSLRSDSYAHFPPRGKFRFTLPGSNQAVEVLAQLAWVNRKGTAGMKFLEICSSAPTALNESASAAPEHPASAKVISLTRSPAMSLTSLREKVFVLRSQPRVALHLIVKQMMALTRATGAVIAMQDGAGWVICLASAGRAPGIGAVLKPDSGLSGECLRSGDVVCCDDAAQDTRVDPKLSKVLGFRSMMVFPLCIERRVVGVLEVLSAEPQRFGSDDVAVLAKIGELVLDVYEPPPGAAEPAADEPAADEPDDVAPEAPPVPVEEKRSEPAPRLELVKPKVEERNVPATQPDAVLSVSKPIVRHTNQGSGVCDVCGHQNASDARDCEKCDVPLPVAIELEAKSIKRKPAAFEIPERDDRLERLVSALWRPVLLLIVLTVAFVLVKSYWRELRGVSHLLEQPKPVSSTASPTPMSRR